MKETPEYKMKRKLLIIIFLVLFFLLIGSVSTAVLYKFIDRKEVFQSEKEVDMSDSYKSKLPAVSPTSPGIPSIEVNQSNSDNYKVEGLGKDNYYEGLIVYKDNNEISRLNFDSKKILSATTVRNITVGDKYILFSVELLTTGCRDDEPDCIAGLNQIIDDYLEVGGVWKFDLTTKEFTQLLKPGNYIIKEEYPQIYTFQVLNESEHIYVPLYYDIQKKEIIVNIITGKVISID